MYFLLLTWAKKTKYVRKSLMNKSSAFMARNKIKHIDIEKDDDFDYFFLKHLFVLF